MGTDKSWQIEFFILASIILILVFSSYGYTYTETNLMKNKFDAIIEKLNGVSTQMGRVETKIDQHMMLSK